MPQYIFYMPLNLSSTCVFLVYALELFRMHTVIIVNIVLRALVRECEYECVCACAPATAFNVVLCRIIGVHLAKTIATIHCTAVNAARSQH